jgi:hypothetical protein
MKTKKLKLNELRVKSFKTSLNDEEAFKVRGQKESPDGGMETPEFWCSYNCGGRTTDCETWEITCGCGSDVGTCQT